MNCDSVLISSSTGSTAYNLSLSSGSIVDPKISCLIIHPIAPMSLSARPIIVGKDVLVTLKLNPECRYEPKICCDGIEEWDLLQGEKIELRASQNCIPSTSLV